MRKFLTFLLVWVVYIQSTAIEMEAQQHTEVTVEDNQVITGFKQFLPGLQVGPSTFANLPSEVDGKMIYCTDCQAQIPCVGSGTGALATGINGNWACTKYVSGGGGGGNINPGTANSQAPTWSPLSSLWIPQNKAVYNTADWMTCDGVTNATGGMSTLLAAIGNSHATIQVTGQCRLAVLPQPTNVTFDFSSGGSISLITNTTPPGGGAFVSHGSDGSTPGQSNPAASPTSTCTATLNNTTAGNAVVMFVALYNTFGPDNARISSVVDSHNFYVQQYQTTLGFASYQAAYVASSITGGNITITANFTHAEKNACIAWEISGLGPVVSIDQAAVNFGSVTPFTTGTATLAAGDFVTVFSEDPNDPQTCTAGAGYTQPTGLAGNVGTASTNGPAQCAEYIANGAGGSTQATQNFSNSPVLSSWGSVIMGLKPGVATWNALGGIYNPDLHQICFNCTGTSGIMDLTGNLVIPSVFPEWWGACPLCSASVNTPAVQASEVAAFGSGGTAKRTNGSGLNIYNKVWYLSGNYQLNGEIQFYHVSGNSGSRAEVYCQAGGGLTQTAANLRILDGQSDAYLRFDNCDFAGTTTSTAFLIDLGYSGAQGTDFAPQFIDFYSVTWGGANVVAGGLVGAKEGGGAQFSNVYCYNCEAAGFTVAAWQIGTPTVLAQNALCIAWYGGDMQSNPNFAFANYGGGYIFFFGTSFEDGYTTQTGFDVGSQDAQGPTFLYGVRTESRKLYAGQQGFLYNVLMPNQDQRPTPGVGAPVNFIFTGNHVTGDGAHYRVTVDGVGGFGGYGQESAPVLASGGSSNSLTDTNNTVAGSVTILTPTASETVTQATTGSTATLLNIPASNGVIPGSATGAFQFHEVVKQNVTNVTGTDQAPSPANCGSCNLNLNNFSGTADATHAWVGQTSGATFTPTGAPVFSATTMLITSPTGSPDSSHLWTGGTSGFVFTPTAAPAPPNWTTNVFAGQQIGIFTGTNQLCYATVASNTATTVTITPPWVTKYPFTICTAPDSTSTFVIEPTWNHGTVVSGGMTLVYMNESVVTGGADFTVFTGRIQDSSFGGGQLQLWANPGAQTFIHNFTTSRADWYNPVPGQVPQQFGATQRDWDVRVILPGGSGQTSINWSYPAIGPSVQYFGPLHTNLGTKVSCWSTGGLATGSDANDVCLGGRSDPFAGTSTSRNIMEFPLGILGRPSPYATNANGISPMQIQGGLSSGNGTPTPFEIWIGTVGSSGTQVNPGTRRWYFDAPSGDFLADTDNINNIGATSNHRPLRIYAATDFVGPIGATTPNTGSFTTLQSSGVATLGSGITKSIQTNVSTNTDLTGILAFAAATTSSTYSFTGTYTNPPDCGFSTTFDPGSGHRIWISTLSTSSLQFTSDTAQTGNVIYVCIGRN